MGEKVSIKVKEREYVLSGTKTYCLYDNKDQDNLLAMAYDNETIKEETKFYTKGVWFEYDDTVDYNVILNERKCRKRIKFPKEPEKRPFQVEIQKNTLNNKWDDLR